MKLNPKHIKAFLALSATSDTRYYLCGVYVDTGARSLVATDGHVMGVWRPTDEDTGGAVDWTNIEPHIIPRAAIENALKVGKISIELRSGNVLRCWTKGDYIDVNYVPVDGRFPEYRRAIPKTPSDVAEPAPGQFDARYLLAAQTFLISLSPTDKPDIYLHHSGPNDAGVVVRNSVENAFCVVMPWKQETSAPSLWSELAP